MKRRPIATALMAIVSLFVLAALTGWMLRFRIATGIVDRKLAGAHVPASYRLTRIGPFRERMEDVRIGDPNKPDLIARRIDVALGYDWSGPVVRAIWVDGVRLRARIDRNGLSLGTIDRLMPKSTGGQTTLPNMAVNLRDVQLTLATPNGTIAAAIDGEGNPQIDFRGTAQVEAPALRLASCTLNDVQAGLAITAEAGNPRAAGLMRIARSACAGLTLGPGSVRMALSSDKLFERISLQAMIGGFGGRAGSMQFARLSGPIQASGRIGAIAATARLNVGSLALPEAARRVTQSGAMLAGTPVGPTSRRAADAVARLLSKADAVADLAVTLHGTQGDAHVRRVDLSDQTGARINVIERGGITWSEQGWRADADLTTGGGALPALTIHVRQTAPATVLTATAQLSEYRAGEARLGMTPLRLSWDGRRATFDTTVRIDGPLSGGFVHGLTVPVRGVATTAGALAVDQGCQLVSFAQLRMNSFTFGGARLSVCGQPIVAQSGGALRIDARTGSVRLMGHTRDGAPVALNVAQLRLTQEGFIATDADAALGPTDRQTHFAIADLAGQFGKNGIAGKFAGGSGAIAHVPLNIADATGDWNFSGGLLRLKGDLRVSDAATAARFNPLSADDALLDLKNNVIRATATLREPTSKIAVAEIDVAHDLSSGGGHALIDVEGITFAPKGLQPEKLTPLTLGVIANVAGTVSGNGRIDWGAQGVTSSGTFGTDRIDLAAAFGPVTGIKGRIHFTDLLGLVSAPDQEATIAEINPGVQVANGVVHYQLTGQSRVKVDDAVWPFAGGTLRLEPTTLDFGAEAERHLTFRIEGLDAAAFVQQLDFPNIAATGRFDGVLPMIFDQSGGRIEAGQIVARRGGGTLAYVGELSNAQLGTMGKLAFDALKAIRYSSLDISLDGRLDGEMVSRVRFTGVREATPEQSLITRLIRNLPFRFNIQIRAPFRGLVGSARAYMDPRLLLNQAQPPLPSPPANSATRAEPSIQTKESGKPL